MHGGVRTSRCNGMFISSPFQLPTKRQPLTVAGCKVGNVGVATTALDIDIVKGEEELWQRYSRSSQLTLRFSRKSAESTVCLLCCYKM